MGEALRWMNAETGEVKEWAGSGTDAHGDKWEVSALELALGLVPDLETWIDAARMRGQLLAVHVRFDGGGMPHGDLTAARPVDLPTAPARGPCPPDPSLNPLEQKK